MLGTEVSLEMVAGGDRNTKFFHDTTLQRRERNRIQRIKDDQGSWIEGKEEVFKVVLEHFQKIYKAGQIQDLEECMQHVPKIVTEEMNAKLMAQVEDKEIKEAVGALKAPGPDGFNALFYQKNWETIKDDIGRAVKDFFS